MAASSYPTKPPPSAASSASWSTCNKGQPQRCSTEVASDAGMEGGRGSSAARARPTWCASLRSTLRQREIVERVAPPACRSRDGLANAKSVRRRRHTAGSLAPHCAGPGVCAWRSAVRPRAQCGASAAQCGGPRPQSRSFPRVPLGLGLGPGSGRHAGRAHLCITKAAAAACTSCGIARNLFGPLDAQL